MKNAKQVQGGVDESLLTKEEKTNCLQRIQANLLQQCKEGAVDGVFNEHKVKETYSSFINKTKNNMEKETLEQANRLANTIYYQIGYVNSLKEKKAKHTNGKEGIELPEYIERDKHEDSFASSLLDFCIEDAQTKLDSLEKEFKKLK